MTCSKSAPEIEYNFSKAALCPFSYRIYFPVETISIVFIYQPIIRQNIVEIVKNIVRYNISFDDCLNTSIETPNCSFPLQVAKYYHSR